MQQEQLHSLVSDLKADVSKSAKPNRKTVADRANAANLAALDMLGEVVASKNSDGFLQRARDLKSISSELNDVTEIISSLGKSAKKN